MRKLAGVFFIFNFFLPKFPLNHFLSCFGIWLFLVNFIAFKFVTFTRWQFERTNERAGQSVDRRSGRTKAKTIATIYRSILTSTLNCTFPYVFTIHHPIQLYVYRYRVQ
ncbi:hypothetical protein L873DRAFT_1506858 [Choiromyces venosus 120613-1]|uniref:Uncharacterized protein n=1 Tax=Choiromyces venosus 120613-1 TaxID=1336337 RepID=A0A3N4J5Y5_9PEZI|nr:hypothetical protein L873DRAFT_1506858 [Choiromyces venosus 120613-1]